MTRAWLVVLLTAVLSLVGPSHAMAGGLKKELQEVQAAAANKNADRLESALQSVVGRNDRGAAKGLLKIVVVTKPEPPGIYWQLIDGLASFTDAKALSDVGAYLVRNPDASQGKDILFALQNNRSAGTLRLYRKLIKARSHPLRGLAVDRLGEHERPEAVDLLLDALKQEERQGTDLARTIRKTLASLFDGDRGRHAKWAEWWETARDTAFENERKGSNTGTVKDELDGARRGALTSRVRRGRVLVLKGMVKNFDHIEKMLKRLGIDHTVMTKKAFMKDTDGALNGTAALILNCNFFNGVCRCRTCKPGVNPNSRLPVCTGCTKHDIRTDKLTPETLEKIKAFVTSGGSVFTEDWGLYELTGAAWPELVRAGKRLSGLEVDYAPVPGQTGSRLLRGVLARPGGETVSRGRTLGKWKVDDKSPAIRVMDPTRVTVLLASEKLRTEAGPKQGAVAVTFSPGAPPRTTTGRKSRKRPRRNRSRSRGKQAKPTPRPGVVLHVLSHFGKQGGKKDEFTLQNLLVNFLLEAWDRHELRLKR